MDKDQALHSAGIFFAALVVAIGGIIYELIIASVSSYLVGDGVLQFSLTIGLVLFGMGIGSYIARILQFKPEVNFIFTEICIGVIGGISVSLMHYVYGFYREYFYIVFILLSVSIGVLIGLEVPLLVKILFNQNQAREAQSNTKKENKQQNFNVLSDILSLDYLGALVASVAFPLFLLPTIGAEGTAYIVGITNILVAGLIYVLFYQSLKITRNIKLLISTLVIASLVLLASLYTFTATIYSTQDPIYKDKIIFSKHSQYQHIVITSRKDDTRLFLNGNLQFSSIDEYRYHEIISHIPLSNSYNMDKVLVLGGGDGLTLREVLKHEEVKQVDLVELDNEIITLAKKSDALTSINNNSLYSDRVNIINQDAYKFLEENTNTKHAKYNVIIADLPDPSNEALNKLYSKEFYDNIYRSLTADGVFITQAGSPFFSRTSFWIINDTLSQSFSHVVPIKSYIPSFGEWGFLLASNYNLKPLTLMNNFGDTEKLKYLSSEILEEVTIFPADLQKPYSSTGKDHKKVEKINTLLSPILYRQYIEDYRQFE